MTYITTIENKKFHGQHWGLSGKDICKNTIETNWEMEANPSVFHQSDEREYEKHSA